MTKLTKKLILLFGVLIILIILLFVSINYGNAKESDTVGKAIYDTLSAEQKQSYWECFKTNKCNELLAAKKNKEYRECSLSCNKQAKTITENSWCEDSDKGDNFLEKGIVKSNIYLSGKEDSCYTFQNGKTYLFEGRCKDNKYQYIQKTCAELSKEYQCFNGKCTKIQLPNEYNGDGTYTVVENDKIISNNNVGIKIIKITPIPDNDPSLKWFNWGSDKNHGNFILFFDIYVNKEKINLYPLYYWWNNYYPLFYEDYGIKLETEKEYQLENGQKKAKITITSIEKEQISSCIDIYNICRNKYDFSHKKCLKYCPNKELAGEITKQQDNVFVFAPKELEQYANYMLDQVIKCNAEIEKQYSIKPFVNKFYLHIYIADLPAYLTTDNGIEWSVASFQKLEELNDLKPLGKCELSSLTHELAHYYDFPALVPDIIEEGFAVYQQHQADVLSETSLYDTDLVDGVGGKLECNKKGFKGTRYNSCHTNCIKQCDLKKKTEVMIANEKEIVVGDKTIFLKKEPLNVFDISVTKDGSTTSLTVVPEYAFVIGDELFLLGDQFTLDKLEDGTYSTGIWLSIYELNGKECFEVCSSTCPKLNEDGTISYSNLSLGYTKPFSHSYATAYCFFKDIETQGGIKAIQDYLIELEKHKTMESEFCLNQTIFSTISAFDYETIRQKYSLYDLYDGSNDLCGKRLVLYAGDQWTK